VLSIYRDPRNSARSSSSRELPSEVIWIDLVNPTDEEKQFVKSRTGVTVPSREALSEIEASSRLIVENGVIYLSTPVVAQGDTPDAMLLPAGFILSSTLLITVRFSELPTFDAVVERVRRDGSLSSSIGVFTALMDALVDRGADVLERLAGQLVQISRSVCSLGKLPNVLRMPAIASLGQAWPADRVTLPLAKGTRRGRSWRSPTVLAAAITLRPPTFCTNSAIVGAAR